MTVLDTLAIRELIPNRYPIFYIDRVTTLVPDQSITAEKYVSVAEDSVDAYLPAELTLPPTLIIETLAQAASILILKSPQFNGKTAYLAGISQVTFHTAIHPGSVLTLEVVLSKVRANMGIVSTQARVGDSLICEAELHFVVSPTLND